MNVVNEEDHVQMIEDFRADCFCVWLCNDDAILVLEATTSVTDSMIQLNNLIRERRQISSLQRAVHTVVPLFGGTSPRAKETLW